MIQIKNVITGSAAMTGGILGVLYCFVTNKKAGGPTLGGAVVYGVLGAAIGAAVGYFGSSNIKEEQTEPFE